jgi:hypothetical protein
MFGSAQARCGGLLRLGGAELGLHVPEPGCRPVHPVGVTPAGVSQLIFPLLMSARLRR